MGGGAGGGAQSGIVRLMTWRALPLLTLVKLSDDSPTRNASNNLAWITMHWRKPAATGAVLAHERTEQLIAQLVYLASAAIGATLYQLAPLGSLAAVLPIAAWLFAPPVRRWRELLGHEVEVQASALLYGDDIDQVRAREADALWRAPAYRGLFDRMTLPEIIRALRRREPVACWIAAKMLPLARRYDEGRW